MKLENLNTKEKEIDVGSEELVSNLYKITPLSKYLALALFIALPFIGGWIGYNYSPEKVVVVEKIVVKEVEVEKRVISDTSELSEIESSSSKSSEEEDVVYEEQGPSRDYEKKPEVVPVDLIGVNKTEIEEIFSLADKEVGTSVYYSELLDVGWTYHSQSDSMPHTEFSFSQTGNVISLRYVFDETNRKSKESVHIFAKEPESDIAEIIKNQFLIGYESVCMVVEEESEYSRFDSDHRTFYLRNTSGTESNPYYVGCPENYSGSALNSFIYNPNVPDKFAFVRGSGDPFVNDGTPGKNNRHWFYSARIVE